MHGMDFRIVPARVPARLAQHLGANLAILDAGFSQHSAGLGAGLSYFLILLHYAIHSDQPLGLSRFTTLAAGM